MFKFKKNMLAKLSLILLVLAMGCSRGTSTIETQNVGTTSSISWNSFANGDSASFSAASLPSSISNVGISTLNSEGVSYTSPVVFTDEDGQTQYVVVLEYKDSALTLNKYKYLNNAFSFEATLQTFIADDTNFKHHQISMFKNNGHPMIVVAHNAGVSIVNATSASETSGEVSLTSIGTSYRVLVDSFDESIFVQSESGIYKLNSSLDTINASNTTYASFSSFSNRLPIVRIGDSVYVEHNNSIYKMDRSNLTLSSSVDYSSITMSDINSAWVINSNGGVYDTLNSTKIGSIAAVDNKIFVAVIRNVTDDTYAATSGGSSTPIVYTITSYYSDLATSELVGFIGNSSSSSDSYYQKSLYHSLNFGVSIGTGQYKQANVVGHSDQTALSVSGSSIYLPINNISEDYAQDLSITEYSDVAKLTVGSSVSSSTVQYGDNKALVNAFYQTSGGADRIIMLQTPTYIISDSSGSVFSVFSFDTSFIADNSTLSTAIQSSGGIVDTSLDVNTVFKLGSSSHSLSSTTASVTSLAVGNSVIFVLTDDNKIYTIR